jgi:hypothetical protein
MFDNVCSIDFKIICLTETWLNDLYFNQKLFPDFFTILVFGADTESSSKSRGGGVLITACPRVRACKRRHDLQFYEKWLWVEIPTHDDRLLICNHYFPPDTKPDITTYFYSLEKNLILKITVFS